MTNATQQIDDRYSQEWRRKDLKKGLIVCGYFKAF